MAGQGWRTPGKASQWTLPTACTGEPYLDVNDEHLRRLSLYGTLPAIPQWDGWRDITEEDHYRLLFKRANEVSAHQDPEATGLYYYIGMDPNVGHLWKHTPAHGTLPALGAATNIALTDCEMVDVSAAGDPTTPPKTEPEPLPLATNVATGEEAKTTELLRDIRKIVLSVANGYSITRAEVEFGVDFGAPESVNDISNEEKGVPVLLCDFIEAPVINAEVERAVSLLDKQYRGSGSRDRGPDESLAKHFIKMVFESGCQLDTRTLVPENEVRDEK
ncbi:hypothetical protein C0992_004675 [Termitomyces sp. T32_za158]|nr:hypothetical protein C0992_004675 [Termitomyces sp. T32_za158]